MESTEGPQSSLISKGQDADWVDSVVHVADTCKKLFTANTCRVCQVYVDEQLEYERQCEENLKNSPSPFQRAWMQTAMNNAEVELYRQFLFDEESVVEVVSEREKEDDDDSHDHHHHHDSESKCQRGGGRQQQSS